MPSAVQQAVTSVTAVLVLDAATGERLFAKYYGPSRPSTPEADAQRRRFEKVISSRARSSPNGEVVLAEDSVVVYRTAVDVVVCVCGAASDASELLLATALDCLVEAMGVLVRGPSTGSPGSASTSVLGGAGTPGSSPASAAVLERRTVLENYDALALAVDEVVHGGIVLEINPGEVVARVQRAPAGTPASYVSTGASEPEPSLSSALSFAKKSLRSFLSK